MDMEIVEINNIKQEIIDVVSSSTVELSSGIEYVGLMTPPNGIGLESLKYETNVEEDKNISYDAKISIQTKTKDIRYDIDIEENELEDWQVQSIRTVAVLDKDCSYKSKRNISTDCFVLLKRLNLDYYRQFINTENIKLEQYEEKEETSVDIKIKTEKSDADVMQEMDHSIILEDTESKKQGHYLNCENIEMAKTENIGEVSDVDNLPKIKVDPGAEYMEQKSLRLGISVYETGLDSPKYENEEDTFHNAEVSIETQFKEEVDIKEHDLDYGQLELITTENVNSDNKPIKYTSTDCFVLLERLNLDLVSELTTANVLKETDHHILLEDSESNRHGHCSSYKKTEMSKTADIEQASNVNNLSTAHFKKVDIGEHILNYRQLQVQKKMAVTQSEHKLEYMFAACTAEDTSTFQSYIEVTDKGNEKYFKCHFCEYITNRLGYIENHFTTKHDGSAELYKCINCKYETKLKSYLVRHCQMQHSKKIKWQKCHLCDFKTKCSSNLLHHRLKHVDAVEMFRCEHCDFKTKCKRYLLRHFRYQHDDTAETFHCELCGYKSRYKNYLLQHYKLKHDDSAEIFQCKLCDYKTKTKRELMLHHRSKHDDSAEIFCCKLCDYKTKIKRTFVRHHKSKHDDSAEIFCCELCDFKTKNKRNFLLHHKSKHDDSAEVSHCELCDYKTKYKHNLLLHHKSKHDDSAEVFYCELCDYKTKYKHNLLLHHKSKHDDAAEIFKCEQCDFKTKTKGNLVRHHKSIHDDSPKIFRCKVCDFKTKHKRNLSRHRSKHEDVAKKFHCEVCGLKTKHKDSLMLHHTEKHAHSV